MNSDSCQLQGDRIIIRCMQLRPNGPPHATPWVNVCVPTPSRRTN